MLICSEVTSTRNGCWHARRRHKAGPVSPKPVVNRLGTTENAHFLQFVGVEEELVEGRRQSGRDMESGSPDHSRRKGNVM